MKYSSKVKKVLKSLEVPDDKAWLLAHQDAFRLVNYLLKEEVDRITKEMHSEINYESPNFGYLKADQAGQLRIIKKLQSLFED